MNGWNRIFVVLAVVWAIVAPFWVQVESNRPVDASFSRCSDVAYQRYGSSGSKQLDMDKYKAERDKCSEAFVRDFVSLPATYAAMVGFGDWKVGGVAWGVIVIPLALLWIVAWGLGRLVLWVVAGFRRTPSV
jgi:hypothetical protein